MTLIEKKQKLSALVKNARAFLDAGEIESYNKADADIDTLQAEIKSEEKQASRELLMNAIPDPVFKASPEDVKSGKVTASPEYKEAFYRAVRGGAGSITSADRKIFSNAMGIGNDTLGGFLVVPAEMESTIRAIMGANVSMRRLATVETSKAEKKIPFVSNFGAAQWIAENGAYPVVDDTFAVKSLGSNKLGKIILVSEELLNDSDYDIGASISRSFARVFGEAEEIAYISGNGVDKPTGILVDAEVGVTTASATAITSDEVLDLFYSLKRGYRANGTFLFNDATEKYIRKIKNAVSGDYMWKAGLTAGAPNTLEGRPIESSDSIPVIAATAKVAAFGDFKQYLIKDTTGMQMQVLDQLYAANGQVGFKGNERTDGKLMLPEAVKLLVMKA